MQPQPATDAIAVATERHDLYGPIHKALRLLMTDTLTRLGSMDIDDDRSLGDAMGQLDAMIELSRLHLAHENAHVHPAMEAVQPGASLQIAQEHRDHRAVLDDLAGTLRAMRSAAMADRARLSRQLYREVARFVADNLSHMAHEEKAHNAVLWRHYGDDALRRLEGEIVAATEPSAMQLVLRWMLPALNGRERASLLAGMCAAMPHAAFAQVLDLARAVLPFNAWSSLSRRLAELPRPGPLTA